MKRILSFLFFLFLNQFSYAQLTPPKTEGLFGGSILEMTGYAQSLDTTLLIVSTESPNSVFKATIKTTSTALIIDSFVVVPSLSSIKGFGSNLTHLAFDPLNKFLFFGHTSGLYYTTENASTATLVENFGVQQLLLKDSILLYIQNGKLNFKIIRLGSIQNSGLLGINLPLANGDYAIAVHPNTKFIYLLVKGNVPSLYKSSAPISNLNAATVFNQISIVGAWPGVNWEGLGIAPDGRIFIGGSDNGGKKILYSDNEIVWNYIITTIPGRAVRKITFAGNATAYKVFFGTAVSNNKGLNWQQLGSLFQETHPNDGNVFVSPVASNCIFMNTDAGLGASLNGGDSIFDINNGIEALQINGLDMNIQKSGAWIASKAGLRKVSNYQSTLKKWSRAMFPNGDGSPYYSVSMVNNDTNRVYAGNTRIYKTNDGGKTWAMVFTPEVPPFNFPSFNIKVSKIAVCPFDTNLIMAAYSAEGPIKGGLFYTLNAGNSWSQLRIETTSTGQDINVNDISIVKETTDTIAYIALNFNGASSIFKGVFRLTKRGSNWLVNPNMNAVNTNPGTDFLAQIEDLELNLNADTLFGAGIDYATGIPLNQIYVKDINGSNKWSRLKMSGFPSLASNKIKVALGKDTLYAAVNAELLAYPIKDSIWFRAYQYPVGSSINFLYYDDLLAGTGVGLYGHLGSPTTCRPVFNDYNPTICFNEFIRLPDSSETNTAGRYQFLYKNKNGCDSIVTITLTVNRPDVSISVKKDTLVAVDSSANQYQWLDCNQSFAIIPGETNRNFIPSKSGRYAIKIVKGFCTDTSKCIDILVNGLTILESNAIKIYPNPSSDNLYITANSPETLNLEIFDSFGRLVLNQRILPIESPKISLTHLPSGLYFIRISSIERQKELFYQTKLLFLGRP